MNTRLLTHLDDDGLDREEARLQNEGYSLVGGASDASQLKPGQYTVCAHTASGSPPNDPRHWNILIRMR